MCSASGARGPMQLRWQLSVGAGPFSENTAGRRILGAGPAPLRTPAGRGRPGPWACRVICERGGRRCGTAAGSGPRARLRAAPGANKERPEAELAGPKGSRNAAVSAGSTLGRAAALSWRRAPWAAVSPSPPLHHGAGAISIRGADIIHYQAGTRRVGQDDGAPERCD